MEEYLPVMKNEFNSTVYAMNNVMNQSRTVLLHHHDNMESIKQFLAKENAYRSMEESMIKNKDIAHSNSLSSRSSISLDSAKCW